MAPDLVEDIGSNDNIKRIQMPQIKLGTKVSLFPVP